MISAEKEIFQTQMSTRKFLSSINLFYQVLKNFIPQEAICDDKDPLWFNPRVNSLTGQK